MPRPSTDSKIFRADPNCSVPDQKHRYILCWLQNFSARQKDDFRLYLVNSKCFSGLAQKNWTGTKHFGTCRRTRHICKTMRGLDLKLTLCMYIFYRPKRTYINDVRF